MENDYKELPEHLQQAILSIMQEIESQERLYRPRQLKDYKEAELYWEGFTDILYDEMSQDWRVVEDLRDENGQKYEDTARNVNIYRAHGESIIAAQTASVPKNRYIPDNPDDPNDISTSKAYSNIAKNVEIHNNVNMMLIRAMFILFNQGLIFGYNFSHKDKSYGVHKNPILEIEESEAFAKLCPTCGSDITENTIPGEMDPATLAPTGDVNFCPECALTDPMGQGLVSEPLVETFTDAKLVVSGYEEIERSREVLEVWGPINVHFPINTVDPKSAGYLILETDQHYALMRSIYPDKKEKISGPARMEPMEEWARRDPRNVRQHDKSLVRLRRVWLRPWMFEILENEKEIEELKKYFPDGAYCVFVNDDYMESHNEALDDHWTVSVNPLSRHIHAPALGRPLMDIQDLTTECVNIVAQTIEHGIPQTFADPKYLDFNAYGKQRVQVGMVYPLKGIPSGQNADAVFHTEKAAVISDEVDNFSDRLDQYAQFVLGDFPSIFGGPQQGGSKTLGEYEASRAMALQRLGLSWKMVTTWYAEMMGKAVKSYADSLRESGMDDYVVIPQGNSYLKAWIQAADLQGKVGKVLPESSEQFPTSWPQKVARFFELLSLNNPVILSMIFTPANASLIKEIIGVEELNIAGEDQRDKQLEEIFELLKGQPQQIGVQLDGMTPKYMPSVPIEPTVDEPVFHIEVTKAFLVSDFGRAIKVTNPAGYLNVVAHLEMHLEQQAVQAAQQAEIAAQTQGQENGNANTNQPANEPAANY